MPSGKKGITKDIVKQAYQRARRLAGRAVRGAVRGAHFKSTKEPIKNDALARFTSDMKAINENGSGMTKEERAAARERISLEFIRSGRSTKGEIEEAYRKQEKYMSDKEKQAIGDDVNEMSKWLDANENQRKGMVAEYYLDSAQFATAHARVMEEGLSRNAFYTLISKASTAAYRNRSITSDELDARIMDYQV
jgi:hypothetical protein